MLESQRIHSSLMFSFRFEKGTTILNIEFDDISFNQDIGISNNAIKSVWIHWPTLAK